MRLFVVCLRKEGAHGNAEGCGVCVRGAGRPNRRVDGQGGFIARCGAWSVGARPNCDNFVDQIKEGSI